MEATNLWNGKEHVIFDDSVNKVLGVDEYISKEETKQIFLNTIILNSTEDPSKQQGNPTELALLKYLAKCGINILTHRQTGTKIFEASFSSDRKRMSTVVEIDGKTYVFLKGASEFVLELSDQIIDFQTNQILPKTPMVHNEVEKTIQKMASNALRTIGVCYKQVDKSQCDFETPDQRGVYNFEKGGFTFVALFGIRDTIREEVPGSIRQCFEAGIQVRMVTGDNKITARAIAQNIGLVNSRNEATAIVMEGPEFMKRIGGIICANCRDLPECGCVKNEFEQSKPENKGKLIRNDTIKNQAEFDKIQADLIVLARTRPEDKYALVIGLKERGNVVAVTGDGTNDAPALKKADVGFAMGIAGTEIAKSAADILIMDDNFASIVKAVKWGRNIYQSIQKFLQFQLTVNVVAVFTTFISAVVLNESIFSAVQMMWINLIMDSLAALALATEPPRASLLKLKPVKKTDYIITPLMIKHIAGQSLLQTVIILILVFAGDKFLFSTMRTVQNQPGSNLIINGFDMYGFKQSQFSDFSIHLTYIFNTFVML